MENQSSTKNAVEDLFNDDEFFVYKKPPKDSKDNIFLHEGLDEDNVEVWHMRDYCNTLLHIKENRLRPIDKRDLSLINKTIQQKKYILQKAELLTQQIIDEYYFLPSLGCVVVEEYLYCGLEIFEPVIVAPLFSDTKRIVDISSLEKLNEYRIDKIKNELALTEQALLFYESAKMYVELEEAEDSF